MSWSQLSTYVCCIVVRCGGSLVGHQHVWLWYLPQWSWCTAGSCRKSQGREGNLSMRQKRKKKKKNPAYSTQLSYFSRRPFLCIAQNSSMSTFHLCLSQLLAASSGSLPGLISILIWYLYECICDAETALPPFPCLWLANQSCGGD